nr:PREDICTED: meiosis arrest female protein 1 isoform X1 [Latimeria chalumnae]XP_014351048.1 PREDICTED: meiosis arrest female protein 1 isoform X1 [Latimeria chalumnae]|eukprot:XP_006007676.1 PREDICTED: meiosis arrest female protein 1 isoform X1 [Latimeria chalumnae]
MMEGNGKENLCNRSFGWLNRPENDAKPWLWKISNCFSTVEQTLPFSAKTKDQMEANTPAVELKEIPSPLHHASSKLFPPVPLPDSQSLTQTQTPLQSGQKVSSCTHCSSGTSCTVQIQHGGGGGGGGTGGSSNHLSSALDTPGTGTITCQVGLGCAFQSASPHKSVLPANACRGLASNFPGVCIESSISSCQLQPAPAPQHAPCCGSLLKQLQPCHGNLHKVHQVSLHQGCASSTCFPCSEFAGRHMGHLEEHIGPAELPTAVCTKSLHLNMAPSVCLKGSHYCTDCLSKPTRGILEAAEVWPNIPSPSAQAASVPMCNGCGSKGNEADSSLLLGTSVSKTSQKHGSSEVAGQQQENLPPIGVFWDIENCSVPSGRSAITVVQRIRDRFFQGHREAEFICVCDISKENKEVIQELNNCQVTVAHINATAKNAADDKLRQSLRRFADTHTAPATVVLVSTDVNFASELSDLRHRHKFQIILVHKNQASEALLHHAHKQVRFEEFVSNLPPRLPVKMQCHTLLYVYNLPTNRDSKSVGNRLRRLSDNCGGKVLSISGSSAVLRFVNQENADRAQKRMENEDVFGNKISVSFTPKSKEVADAKGMGCLGVEKAKSPKKMNKSTKLCLLNKESMEQISNGKSIAGKAVTTSQGLAVKNTSVRSLQELCKMESKLSSIIQQNQQEKKARVETPSPRNSAPACSSATATKSVGIGESLNKSGKRDTPTPRSVTASPVDQDQVEGRFRISSPSAFSKLTISKQLSPLFMSQGHWSSRNVSPSLSNRSSPLTLVNHTSYSDARTDPFANGVDIHISNMDYRMSRKDLQQIIHNLFSRYGKVKNIELSPHTDYQLKATVQMENLQEAIGAVNGLHRYKIGSKRIQVSLATGANNKTLTLLSSEAMTILQDAPACCLPLFKFTEIYEKKFGRKLNVSDLYKLTDTVALRDQGNGRLVCLLPSSQARQSPLCSSQSHDGSSANCSPVIFEELEYYEPVCKQHYTDTDYSESDFDPNTYMVPFVILSLKTFAPQVHSLLQTHEGTVPLLSFPDCYAAEFTLLEMVQEGEGGVPLEHLITCVPGVNIVTAQNGIKVVKWIHNKPPPPNADPWLLRSKSPVGNPQLIQLSREVIDLFKNQPCCIMQVSKFIPTYHHHFAKQCRVSDYGYSKLMELLEAVPHVLQILGLGSRRLLTLTHRAQIKRFTQDLLKLLKSQASKQVFVREFMQAYHWCFSRDWDVTEYGVCELADLLAEIPDTTVCIFQQDNDTMITLPKRERTHEEVERTKQFAKEVVDLLRHQPYFRMSFNQFIPSYHHHFGRQCKLTYYGFNKLVELFESIPDVLQVLECGEEKILTLTEVERIKALAAQFVKLLRFQKDNCLMMMDLLSEYNKTFGYALRLQDYDVSLVPGLMQKLCHVVKVIDTEAGKQIQLINRKSLRALTSQLLVLLMSSDGVGLLTVDMLKKQYEAVHSVLLNPCEYGFVSLTELLKSLPYLVEVFTDDVGEECVRLTKLYQFAKNIRALLHTYHYQQIFLNEFPTAYSKYTGEVLQPKTYCYNSIEDLLAAIPQVVWIKGHGHKKIIVLKNDMKAHSSSACPSPALTADDYGSDLPSSQSNLREIAEKADRPDFCTSLELDLQTSSNYSSPTDQELLCLTNTSPVDLLCGPVPSCLPSPQLRPDPVVLGFADLIQFDEHSPNVSDMLTLTEEKKKVLVVVDSEDCLSCGPAGSSATEEKPVTVRPAEKMHERKVPKKESAESPVKKPSRNKVKLAANFSLAPVTRL